MKSRLLIRSPRCGGGALCVAYYYAPAAMAATAARRVDRVWVPTVFTKNRDRLLEAEVARKFLACSRSPTRHGTRAAVIRRRSRTRWEPSQSPPYPLSHRQPRRSIAKGGGHSGQLVAGDRRCPVTAEAIDPGRRPRQLIPSESRRMNLDNDIAVIRAREAGERRPLRLGPLYQLHPGRSRSLVRHHDRLHGNCLLGHLSLWWKCCRDGKPVRHLILTRLDASAAQSMSASLRERPKCCVAAN